MFVLSQNKEVRFIMFQLSLIGLKACGELLMKVRVMG